MPEGAFQPTVQQPAYSSVAQPGMWIYQKQILERVEKYPVPVGKVGKLGNASALQTTVEFHLCIDSLLTASFKRNHSPVNGNTIPEVALRRGKDKSAALSRLFQLDFIKHDSLKI